MLDQARTDWFIGLDSLLNWRFNLISIVVSSFSGFNKSGFDFLKKMKPMLSDLNTYLTKV